MKHPSKSTFKSPAIPWQDFYDLLEKTPAEQLEKLAATHKTDPERSQVLAELLEAHRREDALLDSPRSLIFEQLGRDEASNEGRDLWPAAPTPTETLLDSPLPYKSLGEFQIVRRLGQGGMGEVFLGRRTIDGGEQLVAIKLLRLSSAEEPGHSPSVAAELLQRFRRERAVLARLNHPGIARLIDHGAAPDGRPFVVLEYVDGLPIDQACRERKLSLDERLELFTQVCEAVHAAHRSLVVHRDIKPTNVLVAERPRLVDFGVAKDLGNTNLPHTVLPRMTPSHASPEQLRGETVTTASDIYSLGVLLCQLLTERLPYRDTATGARPVGILTQEILAGRCRRPSDIVRFSPDASEPQVTSSPPLVPPPFPATALKGDLDAIVLRALALEPDRRYDSAMAMANDIRCTRGGLPISARPDSFYYRSSKFIQRHPIACALVTLATLLLVAAVILLTLQQTTLRDSLARADTQRAQAVEQRQRADLSNTMLLRLLGEASPERSFGKPVTVLEALQRSSQRLVEELGQTPRDRVRLQVTLARILTNLGHLAEAEELLEGATATLEASEAADADLPELRAAVDLERGLAQYRAGRIDASLRIFAEALGNLSDNANDDPQLVSLLLVGFGNALVAKGELAEAESTFLSAINGPLSSPADSLFAESKRVGILGEAQAGLARALANQDKTARALELQTQALQTIRGSFGELAPRTLRLRYERALTLERAGEISEATNEYRAVLEKQNQVQGSSHPMAITTAGRLAAVLQRTDQFAEAEQLYRDSLERLAQGAPERATILINLGWVLHEQGRLQEAEINYLQAQDALTAAGAPEYQFITVSNNRGLRALDQKHFSQARTLLQRSLEIAERLYGSSHSVVAFPLANIARLDFETGKRIDAEKRHRRALEIRRKSLGPNHPDLAHSLLGLARILCAPESPLTEPPSALEGRRSAKEAMELRARANSPYKTAMASLEVAACDRALGRDASETLLKALPKITAVRGPEDPTVIRARALIE